MEERYHLLGWKLIFRFLVDSYTGACIMERNIWSKPYIMVWNRSKLQSWTCYLFLASSQSDVMGLRPLGIHNKFWNPIYMVFFCVRHRNYTFWHDNVCAHSARVTRGFMEGVPDIDFRSSFNLNLWFIVYKSILKLFLEMFRNLLEMTFRYLLLKLLYFKIELNDTLISKNVDI